MECLLGLGLVVDHEELVDAEQLVLAPDQVASRADGHVLPIARDVVDSKRSLGLVTSSEIDRLVVVHATQCDLEQVGCLAGDLDPFQREASRYRLLGVDGLHARAQPEERDFLRLPRFPSGSVLDRRADDASAGLGRGVAAQKRRREK